MNFGTVKKIQKFQRILKELDIEQPEINEHCKEAGVDFLWARIFLSNTIVELRKSIRGPYSNYD